MCNMRGDEKEVADRLEHSEILICTHDEVEEMRKSVSFKDEIKDLIKRYDEFFGGNLNAGI